KNINIRINRNGEIHVSAPKGVLLKDVENFVQKKGDWIIRTLAEMEQDSMTKPDGNLYEGKILYLLGYGYKLVLEEAEKNKFSFTKDSIIFSTPHLNDGERLKKIYMDFLMTLAEDVFGSVLNNIMALTNGEFCDEKPSLSIKNMSTRWGSCNRELKKINLNLQLIKADEKCIEQVILHELVHLKIGGHGKDFYDELERFMPDWKERKERLEKMYKDGI
ncbi:MAG: M48 family metallopeptidase, partial [Lachnospiraceae bacterium]|nr:M48 family metallopeptidase [Lachnospiraceae bacterium]